MSFNVHIAMFFIVKVLTLLYMFLAGKHASVQPFRLVISFFISIVWVLSFLSTKIKYEYHALDQSRTRTRSKIEGSVE